MRNIKKIIPFFNFVYLYSVLILLFDDQLRMMVSILLCSKICKQIMSLDQMRDPNTNIVLDHGKKKYTIFKKETVKNQRHNNNVKSH